MASWGQPTGACRRVRETDSVPGQNLNMQELSAHRQKTPGGGPTGASERLRRGKKESKQTRVLSKTLCADVNMK